MDTLGATARWVAAARAGESERPDRLFEDPWARALAGDEGFELHRRMSEGTGDAGSYLVIRTKFLDDFVLAAAAEVRQFVILAAGMDARAFRLAWPAGTTLFEVERSAVLTIKESILHNAGAAPRCDRRVVAADLAGDDWERLLRDAGFQPSLPACFLVEGLIPYLPAPEVDRLFRRLGGIAAPGSKLGGDIVGQSFLESPWTQVHLGRLRELGIPWLFATDEPERYLAGFGWRASVAIPGEPEAHFGRWPYPVLPRAVPGFPRSYLVRADRFTP